MNELNNKGMTVVEIVLTFSIIMIIVVGMLTIMVNYRDKVSVSLTRLKLETFKNNLTQDIYNDVITLGVSKIEDFSGTNEVDNPCNVAGLNRCVVITFQNGMQKAFGTSKISDPDDKASIINKYMYYDGLKYPLKDVLPDTLPVSNDGVARHWVDLQSIRINDDGILNSNYTVLEDGTQMYIYNIDVRVAHVDFEDDFGIHIVASTIDVSK